MARTNANDGEKKRKRNANQNRQMLEQTEIHFAGRSVIVIRG
jgi:hypothetical protein